ncbi:PREDICTED: mRNAion factor At4g00390 [Prunus dulcis]|uniref:PREDICTED: mRNAion factor At4g00390 n=1 Tax=Prunus dulcis TaxID=3755 RepID=A0A5E4FEH7_PRUDU|nr:PREDICTED: mRNAion factor At4g00390 [Prunus dulcis]
MSSDLWNLDETTVIQHLKVVKPAVEIFVKSTICRASALVVEALPQNRNAPTYKTPISPMAPNHTSPQDEPPEEVEASSEEEVDGEEEEESGSQPESKSEEPEPKGAPTPVAEKKPQPKNPDLATVPQSSSPGSEEVEASARSKRPSESDPKDSKRPKKKKIPELDEEPDQAGEEMKKAGGDD